MHQQHAADLFLLVLDGVEHGALLQNTGIDACKGQRTHERIVHDLECQRAERRFVAGGTRVFGVGIGQNALDGRHVERAGQIIHHGIEQGLHALVLERRAAQHGHEFLVQRTLADQLLQRRHVRLIAFQIGFHGIIVLLDSKLDQTLTIFLRLVLQIVGNFDIFELRAEIFVFPYDPAVLDQIDETLQIALDTDRDVQHSRLRAETIDDRLHAELEVRAGTVQLVDEAHARNFILVRLAPHGFGLRLHAGHAVEAGHSAIEHTERTLDFNREVDVAGGVDDVDAVIVPEAGGCRRGDRDATLLLLLHPVHRRSAIMHFADLVGLAGVIEDPLGRGGLAGVNMRHDADVAVFFERIIAGHAGYSRNAVGVFGIRGLYRKRGRYVPAPLPFVQVGGRLPAIVREGTVGFGHPVRIFALLHGIAAIVGRIHQFAGQTADHGGLTAPTRSRDQPANRQRLGALRAHFDGDLIGGTAHAAATDFDARLDVVEGIMEHLNRIGLGARLDGVERSIDDAFGGRFLAVIHQVVHELGKDDIPELRIGKNLALFWATTT